MASINISTGTVPLKATKVVVTLPRDKDGVLVEENSIMYFENALYLGNSSINFECAQPLSTLSANSFGLFTEPHPTFVHPSQMLSWVLSYMYEAPENLNQINGIPEAI